MPPYGATSSPLSSQPMLHCIYNSLEVLRERNDSTQGLLKALIEEHEELEKKVQSLGINDHLQDSRITALEAQMRVVCAELVRLRSGAPGRSTQPPLRPRTNMKSSGKDRVPCLKCGKVLARSSLKKHMTSKACKRLGPAPTQ